MKTTLVLLACLAAGATGSAHAQEAKKTATPPTVAGTWNMTLMSHQVGLVLEQDGTKVTGTLMMMGTDVKVDGTYADGVLTLTSNARLGARPGAADATPAGHNGPAPEGVPLKLTGKLQDDGTLAGEMPGPNGQATWVAERLKDRKPKAPVAPASGPGLTGLWKMTAVTPQGPLQVDLNVTQDGEKVSGTLTSDHSGTMPLQGTFIQGTLKFSSGGTGPGEMRLDYTAKLKADGTLAGELTGPNMNMPWTAERVKK